MGDYKVHIRMQNFLMRNLNWMGNPLSIVNSKTASLSLKEERRRSPGAVSKAAN